MSFGRRKDGRFYPKDRKVGISYSPEPNPISPKKPKSFFIRDDDDDRRKKDLEEFAEQRKQEFENEERERLKEKKDRLFERLKHDDLGGAKFLLISATPFIVSSDPTMTIATIYATWKFAKFSYDFAIKLDQEYRKTGSLEDALLNITFGEFERQIISKLKEFSVKSVSETMGKSLWNYYKQENQNLRISVDLDKHIQNAMIRTFEEVLSRVV